MYLRKELKGTEDKKKRCHFVTGSLHFVMAALQRLRLSCTIAMASVQWFLLLPTKLTSLFMTSYIGKYKPVFSDF